MRSRWITRAIIALSAAGLSVPAGIAPTAAAPVPVAPATSGLAGAMVSVVGGGTNGADGPGAGTVELKQPQAVVADHLGTLYVADTANCAVRQIDRYGTSRIIAGMKDGCRDDPGDKQGLSDLAATDDASRIGRPTGLAVRGLDLVVVSSNVCVAWQIKVSTTPGGPSTSKRIAGLLPEGTTPRCGHAPNGEPALRARLSGPTAVAWGTAPGESTSVYIAEAAGCDVRRVNAVGASSSTVDVYAGRWAGTTSPQADCVAVGALNPPMGQRTSIPLGQVTAVDLDDAGNLYISEPNLHIVRKIERVSGAVTTVAGVAGVSGMANGEPGKGLLRAPMGLAVENGSAGSRTIFVADWGNCRVRRIVLDPGAQPILSTVAGSGACTSSPDVASRLTGNLHLPTGLDVTNGGDLVIADTFNHRVRRVYDVIRPVLTVAKVNAGQDEQFRRFGNDNTRADDWTGGDGTFSVPLSDGRILWLFGDSYDGTVDPVTYARTPRDPKKFLGNTFAVQEKLSAETPAPTVTNPDVLATWIFWELPPAKQPFYQLPDQGCDYYWPSAGIEIDAGRVQVLVRCIDSTGRPKGVDLWELTESAGTWRSRILSPVPGAFWDRTELTACPAGVDDRIDFGHAILRGSDEVVDGRVVQPLYVYGKEDGCNGEYGVGYAHVARVVPPAGRTRAELGDTWTFPDPASASGIAYTRPSGLTRHLDNSRTGKPDPALINAGAEYSVVERSGGAFRLITSNIGIGNVMAFTAPKPWGPWTPAGIVPGNPAIYQPPEANLPTLNQVDQTRECIRQFYGAKEHPALSDATRAVISYNVIPWPKYPGAACDRTAAEHAHVDNYRPRFLHFQPR